MKVLNLEEDSYDDKAIFLERNKIYKQYFLVHSLDPTYVHYLKDDIGPYRCIPLDKVESFERDAELKGYGPVFFLDDPIPIFKEINSLDEPYPYDLNVELYKFQIRGFNYIKDLSASILNYSMGTGKSVIGTALINYLIQENKVDQVFILCRNHNRTNWQRQLEFVANLDGVIADASGNAEDKRLKRHQIYSEAKIIIANYEKMRLDVDFLTRLLRKRRVLFILDEGAQALKSRNTQLYRATRRIVRASKEARQIVLSGTPLENSPEDIYSVVKLLDPSIFKSVEKFRADYAKTRNPFAPWMIKEWDREKLGEMGMRIAHITHRADKYNDPEIASQFPLEQWEDIIIDMSQEDRGLYDSVTDTVLKNFWQNDDLFSQFLVLQLICDNPILLNISNAKLAKEICQRITPTDKSASKLLTLKDMISQIDGKIVIFNMYNDFGSKILHNYLTQWGIPAVLYDGTTIQKQKAQDIFKTDDNIKVFVSSDQGSDSINLEEASTVINYNQPYKYSTLLQRVNRINRITSKFPNVYYYNLICQNSIEERKMDIVMKKKENMEAIFNDKAIPGLDIASWSKGALYYLLSGNNDYLEN